MFDEAMKLRDQGECDKAVPLFLAALKADNTLVPTEYYLADCYERLGRTASAWNSYINVATKSRQRGNAAQERFASERAAALENGLSRIVLIASAEVAALPGVEIRRDGELLDKAAWQVPVPVDPGKHAIKVTATGRMDVELTVDIDQSGTTKEVEVPSLPPLPGTEGQPPPPQRTPSGRASALRPPPTRTTTPAQPSAPPRSQGSSQRTAGLVTGGLGLAGVVGGGVAGIAAIALTESLRDKPGAQRTVAERDRAEDVANLSTGLLIGGGVLAAAGAVLVFMAPSPARHRAGPVVAPVLGPDVAGGVLHGVF
ncbi:hypothetical protein WMF37_40350 [Sorangium sp. So ce291]|uniref:tetratricopeptide repeat protein n=1 Tax=Sorangium sp. So ce291 TaxID=3133294 RepID=UPI003F63633B